ncbi:MULTISPECIES: sulfurtransferase complex subunit TusD [Erwinia]|uniref:Sulfurtransferase TusD n=1 Tax=Erwinia pyrifoliae TaxID=79967 RepID=A0ABY5X7M5_ERWPY|nr:MULTISPECIES: sulfurtransferase complex subunit TusD [Erwinia]ADP10556.1 Sulfurtransferase TusD (TRNA 2-thiouridine synthesizing protein D) [Erwinia sp. Ejp617]AUX71300.1 sulfurtransferase TusD [Erwinia pyrifoliae]MCA8874980.1 sulfurtransferase complex subunit TusD [Erwinia pyrifoliae]UWS33385.1 sulfurtransferase complex subunit TusD [Erwinia pyrifoliae]UXK12074.1 sulfurtransferase complex subunit TusD [Erwinia pyrifoliae]
MRFCLMVTGPAFGTQHASSAWLFARELLAQGYTLESVFFYREGVLNASELNAPASDEVDLTRNWQQLHQQHGVALNICVAAALRRGVSDEQEAANLGLAAANLARGFQFTGLGALAEAALSCDRLVQF